MRRFFTVVLMMAVFTAASAQRKMADFIITMPDSVVPYLNKVKRTEMVDFYGMGVKAETFNLLSEGTVLDSLTASYAHITLNESSRMQLALLAAEQGDTLLCMVRTLLGEAPESVVSFYGSDWRKLDGNRYLDAVDPVSLLARPDTMDIERYEGLLRLIDPMMVQAVFSPDDCSLSFSLSTPLVTRKEREQLKSILLQRKVKWNHQRFN